MEDSIVSLANNSSAQPHLLSTHASLHHFPWYATSFLGRDTQIELLGTHLLEPNKPLITIVGPGGVGKTRLAIETCSALAGKERLPNDIAFADGIYFVSLGAAHSPDIVTTLIANAVQVSFQGRQSTLVDLQNYLRHRDLLLVLDSVEQLVEYTDLLVALLDAAPKVKLLTTSRTRLKIAQEFVVEISGLTDSSQGTGDGALVQHSTASQLFVERIRRIVPLFSPTVEDLRYINPICEFVEGMPLAIELIATWGRMFSCREIAEELNRNLDLLRTTLPEGLERHHAMDRVFEQSWALLSQQEQAVFQNCSLFQGGFRYEAARQIADADLDTLVSLVDQTLIRSAPTGRYEIHELLRQFGGQRLHQSPLIESETRQRHADYYLRLLANHEQALTDHRQMTAVRAIKEEIANIRSAWAWAVEWRWHAELLAPSSSLAYFYELTNGYHEAETIFESAINQVATQGDSRLLSRLYGYVAQFCVWRGKYDRAKTTAQEGLRIAIALNLPSELAYNMSVLGSAMTHLGSADEGEKFSQEALGRYEALGDQRGIAYACYRLGSVYIRTTSYKYKEARQQFHRSLAIFRKMGDSFHTVTLLTGEGFCAKLMQQYMEARQLLSEGLSIAQSMEHRSGIARCYLYLGQIEFVLENYEHAERNLREALKVFQEIGYQDGTAIAMNVLGGVMSERGDLGAAAQLFFGAFMVRQQLGDRLGMMEALLSLSYTAIEGEDFISAEHYLHEAMKIVIEMRSVTQMLQVLNPIAVFLFKTGQVEAAYAAFAVRLHHPIPPPEMIASGMRRLNKTIQDPKIKETICDPRQATRLIHQGIHQVVQKFEIPSDFMASTLAQIPNVEKSDPTRETLIESLTEREIEVLRLLAAGNSNPEIAQQLVIGAATVKTHTLNIYRKLGVRRRTQAVDRARTLGLL